MKKILPLLLAAFALLTVSCKPSTEDVAKKITEGAELTQEDYTIMLEQTSKSAQEVNDTVVKYKDDMVGLINAFKMFSATHPDDNLFIDKLLEMDPSTLDEENRKLYDKTMKLIASVQETVVSVHSGIRIDKPAFPEENKEVVADDETPQLDSVTTETQKLTEKNAAAPAGDASQKAK